MGFFSRAIDGISRYDVYFLIVFAGYIYLARKGLLPQVESIRRLTSMLDDKGGNILVLIGFTWVFFYATMRLFYFAFGLIQNGKMDAQNAIMMMGISWLTGSMTGGSFSALLKTMSGALTVAPPNATPSGGMPIPPQNLSIGSPPGVAQVNIEHNENVGVG